MGFRTHKPDWIKTVSTFLVTATHIFCQDFWSFTILFTEGDENVIPEHIRALMRHGCLTKFKKNVVLTTLLTLLQVFYKSPTNLLSSFLFPLVLCGLQHLFLPQVEEVRWIGVELQRILLVISME